MLSVRPADASSGQSHLSNSNPVWRHTRTGSIWSLEGHPLSLNICWTALHKPQLISPRLSLAVFLPISAFTTCYHRSPNRDGNYQGSYDSSVFSFEQAMSKSCFARKLIKRYNSINWDNARVIHHGSLTLRRWYWGLITWYPTTTMGG